MGEEQQQSTSKLMTIPKEGERILGPTRRPDGTLRKPIRIRAGYVPQDEVAIYQSKGALLKKAQPEVPPGFDPDAVAANKPKTKSAKRNERKKEKKLQAALASSNDKGRNLDPEQSGKLRTEESPFVEKQHRLENLETVTDQITNLFVSSTSVVEKQHRLENLETVTDQITNLFVSSTSEATNSSTDQNETTKSEDSDLDINKRIRALKKKIRLAEAQLKVDQNNMKPEQVEKITKVEGWLEELKALEDKKASIVS
ncbi:partner of Y14 and mago-like isoform X1 [Asparagus officinalis]|uniref:partner of Y14 and mago-like isoform X1 n=1 Tax=Asparagus officinalis TaxID=4686 RepID=UPI00098E12A1|nr:partner of Y14 and mago-like isoform X1 [Asparagus officinalis]